MRIRSLPKVSIVEGDADVVDSTVLSLKSTNNAGGTVWDSAAAVKANDTMDAKAWNVGVMYDYNLSKNTFVYASAAYTKYEAEMASGLEAEQTKTEAYVGLVHKF